MGFFSISNIVLQKLTGLPSRKTFLRDHVVPARVDDKFNNNRCVQCWDEYTDEHPGIKISPCGHVFGRDCLLAIVNGPAGDLCPYCRVKIFRQALTIEQLLQPLLMWLLQGIKAYWKVVSRMSKELHAYFTDETVPPWLRLPATLLFGGVSLQAVDFVRHRTGICARNPKVKVAELYDGTTVLSQLLLIGFPFLAPVLLPMYYVFGSTAFRASLVAANLAVTVLYQTITLGYYHHLDQFAGALEDFDNEADRGLATYVAVVAIAVQQLMVVTLLWPVSTLGFAWTVLATAAWR